MPIVGGIGRDLDGPTSGAESLGTSDRTAREDGASFDRQARGQDVSGTAARHPAGRSETVPESSSPNRAGVSGNDDDNYKKFLQTIPSERGGELTRQAGAAVDNRPTTYDKFRQTIPSERGGELTRQAGAAVDKRPTTYDSFLQTIPPDRREQLTRQGGMAESKRSTGQLVRIFVSRAAEKGDGSVPIQQRETEVRENLFQKAGSRNLGTVMEFLNSQAKENVSKGSAADVRSQFKEGAGARAEDSNVRRAVQDVHSGLLDADEAVARYGIPDHRTFEVLKAEQG